LPALLFLPKCSSHPYWRPSRSPSSFQPRVQANKGKMTSTRLHLRKGRPAATLFASHTSVISLISPLYLCTALFGIEQTSKKLKKLENRRVLRKRRRTAAGTGGWHGSIFRRFPSISVDFRRFPSISGDSREPYGA
jgi:hypothetical protein